MDWERVAVKDAWWGKGLLKDPFKNILTLFDMGFLWIVSHGGGHEDNFFVVASMIIKFGTGVKLDEFCTMVTKDLWRQCYYVIMTSKPVF